MTVLTKRARRMIVLTVAALTALAVTAAPASALGETCEDRVIEYPFVPWGDSAGYFLAPEGGFEGSASLWTLSGGAKIVKGNEPFYVRSKRDTKSLYLPPGSSAMSARVCVTDADPILRLFVVTKGSPLSTLQVDLIYRDDAGIDQVIPVQAIPATSAWAPTSQIHYLLNAGWLFDATTARKVQFRFTPVADGEWRIDDVYVDPLIWR